MLECLGVNMHMETIKFIEGFEKASMWWHSLP
jgi:hypothetical protein